MKEATFKQLACISEKSAAVFEQKTNYILSQMEDPEIILDRSQPFTAYIIYSVRKDYPETVLELLEMLDGNDGRASCADCPAFIKSKDKRRKWGSCKRKAEKTRCDARACELYYLERRREAERIAEEFEQIPATIK